jgi:hypothetical protein
MTAISFFSAILEAVENRIEYSIIETTTCPPPPSTIVKAALKTRLKIRPKKLRINESTAFLGKGGLGGTSWG